jgi:hypothetical protein
MFRYPRRTRNGCKVRRRGNEQPGGEDRTGGAHGGIVLTERDLRRIWLIIDERQTEIRDAWNRHFGG